MRVAAVALTVLLIGASEAAGVDAPAVMAREESLALVVPQAILRRADVRRHLTNGLTTAIVVVARPLVRGAARSAARVEVRYDPWDEIFFVTHRDFDGAVERVKVASMAGLEKWLSARPIRFAALSSAGRWDLELRILPFTAAEEADVRAWISGTTDAAAEGAGRTSERATAGTSLFDLLVGTSIRARPVLSYRWTVETPTRR